MHYSEHETAEKLGVSVDQLRRLVQRHITHGDEVPAGATYRAGDILVLRVLAGTQID